MKWQTYLELITQQSGNGVKGYAVLWYQMFCPAYTAELSLSRFHKSFFWIVRLFGRGRGCVNRWCNRGPMRMEGAGPITKSRSVCTAYF